MAINSNNYNITNYGKIWCCQNWKNIKNKQ